ncbi:hypothetical protein CISG_02005 [Coccidioides immitis RMSCC 3703]|uniref:Uncharacterized protein n=1 Tax=Coccidioides immitis RMSCC 3703 TaxID=454286 RepID=A0A0J8U037_COCIT|nr:hypothetical protein CISG_02005 [Coccidioides immitis RMSCC 3703]
MARRSSQKDIDPARTPGRLIESMPHAKFYYQPGVTQALPMRPQPQTSNVISRPVSTPSPWVGLFEYLRYIDWQNMKCFRVYPDPFAAIFRSSSCPVPDLSDTPLGRRQIQMISDLARTDPNSEERAFLATKIPDRLEEVLGPRISPFGEPIRMCAPSFFPIDVLTSSPMETTDADVYSPSDSAGAEESDDGYALGDRAYQAILGNSYFSENDIWGQ